nr:hypothetical protein [Heyndrickxia oleronia]
MLLGDDFLAIYMKELIQESFYHFSDTELRVFFLMYFDEVIIDFEKNNDFHISYRLSPFVSLENITDHLTKKIGK